MSLYGIRPHFPRTPAETRKAVTIALNYSASRPTIELYFGVCLECKAYPRRECTCHDEGKGTD